MRRKNEGGDLNSGGGGKDGEGSGGMGQS